MNEHRLDRERLNYGISLDEHEVRVPVKCSLPREQDQRKIDVWGFASGVSGSFQGPIGIETCIAEIVPSQGPGSARDAYREPGTLWVAKGRTDSWLPYGIAFSRARKDSSEEGEADCLSVNGLLGTLEDERRRSSTSQMAPSKPLPEGFSPLSAGIAVLSRSDIPSMEEAHDSLVDQGLSLLDPESSVGDTEYWLTGASLGDPRNASSPGLVVLAGDSQNIAEVVKDAILSFATLLYHASHLAMLDRYHLLLTQRVAALRPGSGATVSDAKRAREDRIRAEAIFLSEVRPFWSLSRLQAVSLPYSLLSSSETARLEERWGAGLGQTAQMTDALRDLESQQPSAPPSGENELHQRPPSLKYFEDESSISKQIRLWWAARSEKPVSPPTRRTVRLQPFGNRGHLVPELSSSLSLNAFLTASCAIFLNQLLDKGEPSVAVVMLFVSFFGFLFGALLYGSTLTQLARRGTFGYYGRILTAKRLTEYLGVFPLMLGIPLGVQDLLDGNHPIEYIVLSLTLGYFLIFTNSSHGSLLSVDFSNTGIGSTSLRRRVLVPVMAGLIALTFVSFAIAEGNMDDFTAIGGVLGLCYIAVCIALFLLSSMLPREGNLLTYEVDDWDSLDDHAYENEDRPLWHSSPRSRSRD